MKEKKNILLECFRLPLLFLMALSQAHVSLIFLSSSCYTFMLTGSPPKVSPNFFQWQFSQINVKGVTITEPMQIHWQECSYLISNDSLIKILFIHPLQNTDRGYYFRFLPVNILCTRSTGHQAGSKHNNHYHKNQNPSSEHYKLETPKNLAYFFPDFEGPTR